MVIEKYYKIESLLILFILMFLPRISFAAPLVVPNPGGLFTVTDANGIIVSIATFIVGIIGILGITLLVWGGILYVTSAGDDDRIEKAKTTITYAVIGLFVAGFAYGIEVIVFSLFTTAL